MLAATCWVLHQVPPGIRAAVQARLCNSSRRKGSETFDNEALVIGNEALGNTNFEEDKLWAILRPVPGLLLWVSILACLLLPLSAPHIIGILVIASMVQNILTMLFSTLYTFQGFRHMERSMMNPVAIPPRPASVVAGTPRSASPTNGTVAAAPTATAESTAAAPSVSVPITASSTVIVPSQRAGGSAVGGLDAGEQADAPLHAADVVHLIAICRCTEPVEVIEDTIDHLACHSNRSQYIILLALEAKDNNAAVVGEGLVAKYAGVFMRVMYAIHPSGLEWEVPGKSANVNWAARSAHASLDSEYGPRMAERVVVTVADCDAKVSEHYFNELSVRFAAAVREKREVLWAPPSLFDEEAAEEAAAAAAALEPAKTDVLKALLGERGKRIVKALLGGAVPGPVKIADQMWSMFVLQNLTSVNWVRLPCSTYSVGLRLAASVGYWDTGVESVPEDYHTALKIYWGTAGRARCEPIYHPVLYQHIEGGTWANTCNQRFQQGIRHMWGATDLPYIFWLSIKVPTVPLLTQLRIVMTVVDVHVNAAAVAFFSTFAMPLIAVLAPKWFSTPFGATLLSMHQSAILFLWLVTLVTGAIYEWYATEMVAVCKRRLTAPSIVAAEQAAAAGQVPPAAPAGGYPPAPMGMLEKKNRSVLGVWSRVTGSGAYTYVLRMLPWLWAPLVAVMYLLGPSAVAQTKLIFNNRMRPHVSPKSAPTPSATPRALMASPSSAGSDATGGAAAGSSVSVGGAHGSMHAGTPVSSIADVGNWQAASASLGGRAIRLTLPAAAFGRGMPGSRPSFSARSGTAEYGATAAPADGASSPSRTRV